MGASFKCPTHSHRHCSSPRNPCAHGNGGWRTEKLFRRVFSPLLALHTASLPDSTEEIYLRVASLYDVPLVSMRNALVREVRRSLFLSEMSCHHSALFQHCLSFNSCQRGQQRRRSGVCDRPEALCSAVAAEGGSCSSRVSVRPQSGRVLLRSYTEPWHRTSQARLTSALLIFLSIGITRPRGADWKRVGIE